MPSCIRDFWVTALTGQDGYVNIIHWLGNQDVVNYNSRWYTVIQCFEFSFLISKENDE